MIQKTRLLWKDADWATYLGCPVAKITEYKKILDDNFLTTIERNKYTGKYSMAVYRYDTALSGNQRLALIATGDAAFNNLTDALHDANNVISVLELDDNCAKLFNIPKKAIQMMLIRQK